jgi:oxygen-independent coproporphyrinogen-3 oxidase
VFSLRHAPCAGFFQHLNISLIYNSFRTLTLNPGLYIHVPFCTSKCPYCGFYSIASYSLVPRWLTALKKEIFHYGGRFDFFDSLYLGGGTPTLLSLGDIEGILDSLFKTFTFATNTEITIEANPGDMSDEKMAGLKSLGFNRINLGVQSFDDRDLSFLGRKHTTGDAEDALEKMSLFGFDNVGVDLIYGLEQQTMKGWMKTLKKALSHRPAHISCYQLTIEKKTPFGKMSDKGLIKPVGEKRAASYFLTTSAFLEEAGYIHYEISNFAKGISFYSRHNSKYWQHVPYLGLGPSAHSFQDSKRWWNISSVRKYCESLEHGKPHIEGIETLTEEQKRMEAVFLGLRTLYGMDINKIGNDPVHVKVISQLRDSGHIRVDNGRIIPTKKGFLVADHLPLYFLSE